MPMHTHILENIHALLDYNDVPKMESERRAYFSHVFGLSLEESQDLLEGKLVPNRKLLKLIADKFEVDPLWLIEN
jgi:hypothetical protein